MNKNIKYKLQDLIDSERINKLLDLFHKTTGFLTAILDLEGNVLSKSGWREICTDFHRVNPKTCKKCLLSDTILSGQMAEGEKYHSYECLNGLVDVTFPIIIDGDHLGNLFTGQFLFDEPDLDFFRNQANECGFDEERYMNALKNVPIVSEDDAKNAMDFLLNMTLLFCDITKQKMERKQSEQSLLKEKQYLEAVFNSLSEGIVSCDENGILNRFNNATMEFHGLPKEPISANEWANYYNLYYPDGITRMLKEDVPLFRALKNGIVKDAEMTIIPKNGNTKTFVTNGQRITDSDGNSLGAVIAMHDITQRKETEKSFNKSQALLRATGKMAKVGGWEIDLSTQYLTWTEELYHIHEVEKGFQPTVEKAIDFYAPDSKPIILTAVERAIKYGEKFDFELQIVTAKGNILDVHAVGESLSDEGKVVKVLGTFHDITVRKKAEKELTNYRENLEVIIKERTLELEEKNKKSDELNKVFVGRELRMAELKKEIENLKDKIKS